MPCAGRVLVNLCGMSAMKGVDPFGLCRSSHHREIAMCALCCVG